MKPNKKSATPAPKNKSSSGLGLDNTIDLSRYLRDDDVHSHGDQRPMELDLSLIDEDPHQPRTEFNEELLQEMAQTIRARGVKNPISVHKNASQEGRFIINDGARRYRASKIAGKKNIPAFLDSDFTKIDQIIVNAHHETFTPREWAVLIDQEKKQGKNQAQIAEDLGKSRAFITQHAKLLTLPDPISQVFNSGRCTDATSLNELAVMRERDPKEVDAWLSDENMPITRGTVKQLREFLHNKHEQPDENNEEIAPIESAVAIAREKRPAETDPTKLRKAIVQVRHEGRAARLLLNRRPSAQGLAWLKYDDDGTEFETTLDRVKLVAVLEA